MNDELRIMNGNEGKIRTFYDLNAWKIGHEVVIEIYKITKTFPKDEMFALTSQMRRCAVSITSNIAEGFSRQSYKEKLQFYSMSQGSVTELQNQALIAKDVEYLDATSYDMVQDKLTTLHKILNGLIKSTRAFPR